MSKIIRWRIGRRRKGWRMGRRSKEEGGRGMSKGGG